MKDTCVFVSSSDNTFDVFSQVSKSITENWPIDDFDLYVGLNERVAEGPFRTLAASTSGWRSELECQINALPEQYQYIILVLDDFFFYDKVNLSGLVHLIDEVKRRDIDYLRLKPLERSGLGKILLYLRRVIEGNGEIVRLGCDEPYYASLQVAVWKRSYLSELLGQTGSIWDFEHKVGVGSVHYATVRSFLRYEHLVEKGRWFKHAPVALGNPNVESFELRGFEKSLFKHSKIFNKIKFFLFGYVFFRMRRTMLAAKRGSSD